MVFFNLLLNIILDKGVLKLALLFHSLYCAMSV